MKTCSEKVRPLLTDAHWQSQRGQTQVKYFKSAACPEWKLLLLVCSHSQSPRDTWMGLWYTWLSSACRIKWRNANIQAFTTATVVQGFFYPYTPACQSFSCKYAKKSIFLKMSANLRHWNQKMGEEGITTWHIHREFLPQRSISTEGKEECSV